MTPSVQLLLGVAGVGGMLALVVYMFVAQAEEKAVVRSSLRQLDGYEATDNLRDKQMLNPLRDRALAPAAEWLTGLGRRLTPIGYIDSVKEKFVFAGKGTADSIDRFLAIRVLTVALIPVVLIFVYGFSPLSGLMAHGVFALVTLALAVGPDAILNRQVVERQHALRV
jgi:hypothetical protein